MKRKGKRGKATPTAPATAKPSPVRFALDTLPGVIKEICAVYRLMRQDELDHVKGRSLVWVLSMLRAALETQVLERWNNGSKNSPPQSKVGAMATRAQIARLSARIEALTPRAERGNDETEAEALERHFRERPEDREKNRCIVHFVAPKSGKTAGGMAHA